MSVYSCINCNVKFANADIQRDHYKTDWHRYNLKRRVSALPPVTAEEFQLRVNQAREAKTNAIQEQQMSLYCNACRKQFGTQKAHDNHLNSKKHKENLTQFQKEHTNGEDVTTKRLVQPRELPAMSGKKKFLNRVRGENGNEDDYEDYEEDQDDDSDYEDIDEEEVDDYELDETPENTLTEKDCLFCSNSSEDVVQNLKHMSIQHSFFIPDIEYCIDLEGLLHYLGEKITKYFICLWCNDRGKTFYSLDAVRKHMKDKGHCQMLHEGLALAEYTDYYDYSSSYPDHEEGMDVDEEVVPELLDGDEYELVLPSGAVIGHRSLLRYYKQRLNPNRTLVVKKSDRKLHHVLSEYRALGWTQTQQKAAARKARDIHLMKRVQANWQMKLGCKANKLQKHFRQQVLI